MELNDTSLEFLFQLLTKRPTYNMYALCKLDVKVYDMHILLICVLIPSD